MVKEIVGCGWAFPPHTDPQGRMALTNERNELQQSIQVILSTSPGQRVMRPRFGCKIQELVFAPNNSHTTAQVRRYVEEALGMWEPRINLIHVDVKPDPQADSALLIEISYEEKTTRDRRSLVYPFYLIPEE
ncbi:MAG: GPW/gp25 family protein [Anaerolineales bacterium]|nr:GPW/gp25 family protein [Anaerolineales bacterium]